MAEKDTAEKYLEEYPDVFADIVNVLLFNGEQVVKPQELRPGTTQSHYKADGKAHELRRDTAKSWQKSCLRIARFGLENQTKTDADMVLRVFGYDAADYREQIRTDEEQKRLRRNLKKRNKLSGYKPPEGCEPDKRYPVITLVLYFGSGRWSGPTRLSERISIPDKLRGYVNDYRLHVFEISMLTEEQVRQFRSDFRIVADYFVQTRKGGYHPSKDTIEHVDAVLQMMSALTNDRRFERVYNEQRVERNEVTNMCDVLDKVYANGRQDGWSEGQQCGEMQKLIELICKKLMKKKALPQIADELEETEDSISRIYEAAKHHAPDYDVDAIYQELTVFVK